MNILIIFDSVSFIPYANYFKYLLSPFYNNIILSNSSNILLTSNFNLIISNYIFNLSGFIKTIPHIIVSNDFLCGLQNNQYIITTLKKNFTLLNLLYPNKIFYMFNFIFSHFIPSNKLNSCFVNSPFKQNYTNPFICSSSKLSPSDAIIYQNICKYHFIQSKSDLYICYITKSIPLFGNINSLTPNNESYDDSLIEQNFIKIISTKNYFNNKLLTFIQNIINN